MLRVSKNVRNELAANGWSRYSAEDYNGLREFASSITQLQAAVRDLPVDPYSGNGTRRRRHSRFVYLPWTGLLVAQPSSPYFQDSLLNPVDGGVQRRFEALSVNVSTNQLLVELVRLDFSLTPFPGPVNSSPVDVGVHLIAYQPEPDCASDATPDSLHKDGEPFTFVHLILRTGVEGGETIITTNDMTTVAEFTLVNTLDTFAVRDDAVFHRACQVRAVHGYSHRVRAVLIIDFTPFVRRTPLVCLYS